MKTLILLAIATSIQFHSVAQKFENLLALFQPATLPYEFPEGASYSYGDEEEEEISKYSTINLNEFNTITGADLYEETSLEAVDKIECKNFYILVVFEHTFSNIDGMISNSFVYYIVDKKGKYLDSRYACSYSVSDDGDVFRTLMNSATMAFGDYEGDENNVIVTQTEEESERNTTGNYGMERTVITTTYSSIDEQGTIEDVTTRL